MAFDFEIFIGSLQAVLSGYSIYLQRRRGRQDEVAKDKEAVEQFLDQLNEAFRVASSIVQVKELHQFAHEASEQNQLFRKEVREHFNAGRREDYISTWEGHRYGISSSLAKLLGIKDEANVDEIESIVEQIEEIERQCGRIAVIIDKGDRNEAGSLDTCMLQIQVCLSSIVRQADRLIKGQMQSMQAAYQRIQGLSYIFDNN